MPGRRTSSTRHAGNSERLVARNSEADLNVCTSSPIDARIADATAPTSSVTLLNPFSGVSFTVAWSGSHSNGVGVATFDVYVSDNGGAFTVLVTGTTQTSTTFAGATWR